MDEASDVLLAVYPSTEGASAAFDRLVAHARARTLALVDLGLIRRDPTGKVALEAAPAGAPAVDVSHPSAVAGVVGLVFAPNELASSIGGDAIGAVAIHLKRTGVDGASLRRLGAVLDPGESAILVVVERRSVSQVEAALTGFDHLVRTRLGPRIGSEANAQPAPDEGTP